MKIKSYKSKGKTYYEVSGYLGVIKTSAGETKRKNFHRRGFESSKAATLAYSREQERFDNMEAQSQEQESTLKFKDVYAIWLESYQESVKESTLNRVEGIFKNHILPMFQNRDITSVTWQECQSTVLKWRKNLVDFNKVAQYARLVFRTAQKMGLISTNPMDLVDVMKNKSISEKAKHNYWTSQELSLFLNYLARVDENTQRYDRLALFYLLATTGMRKGELLALTWNDVNFTEGTVSIDKTMTRKLDNGQTVGSPKTQNAYRTLALDPVAGKYLKRYRKSLLVIPTKDQRIFRSQQGGPLSLMTPNHWLDTLIDQVNSQNSNIHLPRITVHGLRHTFASIQVINGVNVKALQLQLGHSDFEITLNIYTHLNSKQVAAQVYQISDVI